MSKVIHIVGCSPRSGTSLLQELMTTCFKIDSYCEHEQSIFKVNKMKGDVVCTKSPREMPYMPWLLRVDPELHVIYMLRDPRSVVVSKHKKAPDQYYSNLKVWKANEHYRKQINDHKRFLVIKYEDLVMSPDIIQKTIEESFPFLLETAPFSEFHKRANPSLLTTRALNGLRPISNNRIDSWQNHLPRVKAQINRYGDISDDLIELGYETSFLWQEKLKDIEPDYYESIQDEHYTYFNTLKMKYRIFRKTVFYIFEKLLSRTSSIPT
ncbi:sulfotransferase [Thermodesulfobacteriota bacterium]